jgi:uncharacterized protein (UPF0335 family)
MGENSNATNGFSAEKLGRIIDQIDRLDDELSTLRGQYMKACQSPRGRIRDVLAVARHDGANLVALREILHKHRQERRQQARIDALEADDQAEYEMMVDALGDYGSTELGQSALDRARHAERVLDNLG